MLFDSEEAKVLCNTVDACESTQAQVTSTRFGDTCELTQAPVTSTRSGDAYEVAQVKVDCCDDEAFKLRCECLMTVLGLDGDVSGLNADELERLEESGNGEP